MDAFLSGIAPSGHGRSLEDPIPALRRGSIRANTYVCSFSQFVHLQPLDRGLGFMHNNMTEFNILKAVRAALSHG